MMLALTVLVTLIATGAHGWATQCLTCDNQPSHDACMQNGQIRTCDVGNDGGCQTEVRVQGSQGNTYMMISKRCKGLQWCQQDETNSIQYNWCQGDNVPGSACYYCCDSDNCNTGGATGSPTTTTQATTTAATTTTQATTTTTGAQQTTTTSGSGGGGGSDNSEYSKVLEKSILFYEAQRSGHLPDSNRVTWRGDSALNDGSDNGVDLTGGWYDAGDHVKFNFPMAWSVTTLAWGLVEFKDGYSAAGELDNMYDSIKWPLDYFIKCHVSANVLYGQVGDGGADHGYWGRPEAMTMFRPSWKIDSNNHGADLAGETAAAMAASSIAFQSKDSSYANTLLTHAKQLFSFAKNNRGKYSQSISNAGSFYSSSDDRDELAWAAAWLYRATNDNTYLNDAKSFYDSSKPWAFSWDDKKAGVQLMMYILTGESGYKQTFQNFINGWISGSDVSYTNKGLAWRDQWGPLRYSANSAFLALVGAKHGVQTSQAEQFARNQIDYMMGSAGRSYIVGYGTNPPQRPHHRSASCSPNIYAACGWNDYNSPNASPNVLEGALVGGPDQGDNYSDDRGDYIKNEVACDYNAGFQAAVAGLVELQ